MEDNKNNGYEKICCMCRRTESQAGKMITLPGGLQVCRDCMQRSFDMMMGSGMDWTKMSGITPELLKNMYLNPMGSGDGAQKQENTGTAAGKKDDVSEAEKQNSVDNPTEADTDEDAEQTVVDADETEDGDDFEEDGDGSEGIPLGNIFGIPVGQIDLGALMGGAIITEGIFNIHGVGGTLWSAIIKGEPQTVVSMTTVLVMVYIIANLIVDLLYAVLDPRIRYE